MMRCATARILWTQRLHEPLSLEAGQQLERHLARCAACRRELAAELQFEPGLRRGLAAGAPVCVEPAVVLRNWQARGRSQRRGTRVGVAAAGVGAAGMAALAAWALWPAPPVTLLGKMPAHAVAAPSGPRGTQVPRAGAPFRTIAAGPASPRRPETHRQASSPPSPAGSGRPSVIADDQYLDGRDPRLQAHWMAGNPEDPQVLAWVHRHLPPAEDDFVQIPLPRLAATDPKSPAAGEAIRKYEEEAKVVDARLFRKVTLSSKAEPLEALCGRLAEQTGVKIQASRGVRDERVTVFVEDRPARDVMREVARLFGYHFGRTGEPNAYQYELVQDLRSQLAEEEMRNRDVHEALLALDEEMAWFRPYLGRNMDQQIERVNRNQDGKDTEANRLYRLVKGGGWGPAQLYFRLSPAERSLLLAGKQLSFTMSDADPERRLPAEWREPLLKSSGLHLFPGGAVIENVDPNTPSTPVHQVVGLQPEVRLTLNRSEAGEMALQVGTVVSGDVNGHSTYGGSTWEIARGRSPSTANPDNAAANAALKSLSLFQQRNDFDPQPSCPRLAEDAELKKKGLLDPDAFVFEPELREPHVNTADVWEEIHRRTHLPIVADAYTRLYVASRFKRQKVTTFEALCQLGDGMGVRWKKDGEFLLGRSTSFFWDKLKEVPDRLLVHWQEDRDRQGALPLEDLVAMAALSDEQVGSRTVGLGITHCRGLDEWGIIAGGPSIGGELLPEYLRKQLRALTVLTAGQLRAAQTPQGLTLETVTPPQREVLGRELGWGPDGQQSPRLLVSYIPRGRYVWRPLISQERYNTAGKFWPRVSAATREEALAQARKYEPEVDPRSVTRTRGRLDIVIIRPDGELIGPGGPRVEAPL
jgi:hypothetical protein